MKDYLSKQFFYDKYSNKKLHIHYIGKFDYFWNNIPDANLLYKDNLSTFNDNLDNVKKFFPITYSQNFRRYLITISNCKKDYSTFIKFFFNSKLNIYFGNITPKKSYISNLVDYFMIDETKIYNLILDDDAISIEKKVKFFNEIIFQIKDKIKNKKNYQVLIEFINIFFRIIISNFIKNTKNTFIYDGHFLNKNFINIYNSLGGNQHNYIDFGSKVGFDTIYPRVDDIIKYRQNYKLVSLDEEILNFNEKNLETYFLDKIIDFKSNLFF